MLPASATAPVISPAGLAAAYSYTAYRQLIAGLLAEGKTTGPIQNEALLQYAHLNVQRMARLDKTVHLLPALHTALHQVRGHYKLLVITEGWCGDAAQLVPVVEAIAQASAGHLTTHYVLRDEHPALIDRYLTNGGRAIPKIIALHADTLTEIFHWGPRPVLAQQNFLAGKALGMAHDELSTQLHTWYARDKTLATQQEWLALVAEQLP